jgi:hypothetical protein
MHPSAILVPWPDSMAFFFASAPRQGSRTSSSSSHSMFCLALQLYTLNRKQQTPTVAQLQARSFGANLTAGGGGGVSSRRWAVMRNDGGTKPPEGVMTVLRGR